MINLCLDIGVLLTEKDIEFECFNIVYDKKYGYFDENQIVYLEKDKEKAIEYAKEYVKNGCNMSYAIITDQGQCENGNNNDFDDGNIEGFTYNVEDIIYSIAKIDEQIIENFITTD